MYKPSSRHFQNILLWLCQTGHNNFIAAEFICYFFQYIFTNHFPILTLCVIIFKKDRCVDMLIQHSRLSKANKFVIADIFQALKILWFTHFIIWNKFHSFLPKWYKIIYFCITLNTLKSSPDESSKQGFSFTNWSDLQNI